MNKKLRQQIYDKYEGKCAYTGHPLEPDWQVDHIRSKHMFEQVLVSEDYYECPVTKERWSVTEAITTGRRGYYHPRKTKPHPDVNHIDNLVPTQRLINHYKRSLDLEGFRQYMMTFHVRLAKLPRKTAVEKTQRRIEYMSRIAQMFGIAIDKPFNGKFWFEK